MSCVLTLQNQAAFHTSQAHTKGASFLQKPEGGWGRSPLASVWLLVYFICCTDSAILI